MSLVRNQGFKNFLLMQQKMARRRKPGGGDDQKRVADYCGSAADAAGVLYRLPRPAAAVAAGAEAPDAEADAASARMARARARARTAASPWTASLSAKIRSVSVTIKIAECKRGGVSRPFCCLFRHLLRKRKFFIFLPLKAPFLPLSLSPRGRNPHAGRRHP